MSLQNVEELARNLQRREQWLRDKSHRLSALGKRTVANPRDYVEENCLDVFEEEVLNALTALKKAADLMATLEQQMAVAENVVIDELCWLEKFWYEG